MLTKIGVKGKSLLRSLTLGTLSVTLGMTNLVHAGPGHLYAKHLHEPEVEGKKFESVEVFLKYLRDPLTAELWQNYLISNFQTDVDRNLESFFRSNPIFSQIYTVLEENQEAMLQNFLIGQREGVQSISDFSDEMSLRIKRAVQDIALKMGFRPEVVEKMHLFMQLGGSANAFTVSGTVDLIIISINLETVKQMKQAQLEAVIAHELGHILNRHVIKGTMLDLMFSMMLQVLTDAKGSLSAQNLAINMAELPWRKSSTIGGSHVEKGDYFEIQRQMNTDLLSSWLKSYVPNTREQIHSEIFNQLLGLGETDLRMLFAEFLIMIRISLVLTGNETRSETIQFLTDYTNDLRNLKKPLKPESLKFFATLFNEFSNTLSRAMETTCDKVADAFVTKLEVASAMALLVSGTGISSPEDRFRLIQNAMRTLEENEKMVNANPQLLADIVKGKDHPEINRRILQIMTGNPALPAILVANNFTRPLLLEELYRFYAQNPDFAWSKYLQRHKINGDDQPVAQTNLKSLFPQRSKSVVGEINFIPEDESWTEGNQPEQGAPKGPDFKTPEELQKHYQTKHDALVEDVIDLVIRQENKLSKPGSRNPRFDNLMQYMGARYQMMIDDYTTLEKENLDLEATLKKFAPNSNTLQTNPLAKQIAAQINANKNMMVRIGQMLQEENPIISRIKSEFSNTSVPWSEILRLRNNPDRLKDLENLSKLAPAIRVGSFDTEAIKVFQESVTPNVKYPGVFDEQGHDVYARSRIPPGPGACRVSLKNAP